MDYRKLNKVTTPDPYPIPRVDDLLDGLGQAQYISKLDLTKGYCVDPASKHKTAFVTPLGKYQVTVMPFGLVGSPVVFQRMMNTILADILFFASAFIDDVALYSKTWEEHIQHLTTVFTRLREAKLTAKGRKCELGMRECFYLGHVVGCGQVRPEQAKVSAISSFLQPQTIKDVRSFLGLAGYYRRFIPDFASAAAPLSDLTRKDAPDRVLWSPACQDAFDKLKKDLSSNPVLTSPDFDQPFVIQTDASNVGIGAVLSQSDEKGQDRPIAYFSHKLLPRETKYATVEKECLAIVEEVRHFRVCVTGIPFTVQTDFSTSTA